MRRGSNLPAVGTYNQTLVLDLIRRSSEGISRIELADRTGLSAQTLSNVARRLVDEGWVVEGTPVVAGPGKPRTPLRLRPTARFAVGIHLDPAVDTLVVVDLSGGVMAHAEHIPRQQATAAELVADLALAIESLLASAGVDRERVLGIGVAAPGPLDADSGDLLEPPLLPAWHHVALRERLHEATDLATTVEKDVVAAMIGELWTDARQDLDDAIFVYYGAGVGAGLAMNGTPLRGRTGNAGDVAHLVVEPGGPECPCGQRGCLGVSIAPERLLADAGIIDARATPQPPALRGHMRELAARAAAGDDRAGAAIRRAGESLARAVVQINNLLDADVVVVGGPLWSIIAREAGPVLGREAVGSAAATTVRSLRVLESRLGTDVAAVGAACVVLDAVLTARPSDLMISPL